MTDHTRWKTVLGSEDAANLERYSRTRKPYEGRSPALLVIDVTEAFVGPNAPVADAQEVSRQACGEHAWAAMPGILRLVDSFRSTGRPVIFTAPDPVQRWVGAATIGEIVDGEHAGSVPPAGLTPGPDELLLLKTKASAFFGTALVSALVDHGIDTVVVAGGTTSGCVRATAIDASSYGFEVIVADDACFDRITLSHDVALVDLEAKYARVMSTPSILDLLGI